MHSPGNYMMRNLSSFNFVVFKVSHWKIVMNLKSKYIQDGDKFYRKLYIIHLNIQRNVYYDIALFVPFLKLNTWYFKVALSNYYYINNLTSLAPCWNPEKMQWKFYLQSSFPCTTCFTFINKFLKYDICMYLQQEIGLFDIFNIITLPYFQHHNWSSRAFYIMEHNCDSLLSLWCYSLQCCVLICFELLAID